MDGESQPGEPVGGEPGFALEQIGEERFRGASGYLVKLREAKVEEVARRFNLDAWDAHEGALQRFLSEPFGCLGIGAKGRFKVFGGEFTRFFFHLHALQSLDRTALPISRVPVARPPKAMSAVRILSAMVFLTAASMASASA